ncbi:hypothetical protein [Leptothrix discophora]|uniref:Uncharacterized protein n=1 Tax=Leptothrix discophora TaxID=89 RepID=A0ABT9G0H6_LEPDI|nr:hypothetical protein [Leptothrix discophora]MDP4299925.1 hypothetical protein [Leptothrix discophora]
MSFDYSNLQVDITAVIAEFGQVWSITRGTASVGRARAIRAAADFNNARAGMRLAAIGDVVLLFDTTRELLPGDTVTCAKKAYIVSRVEAVQPGDTTIYYRVTAS